MGKKDALSVFNLGGLIAYPTEAVFGLGCDPDNESALQRLLRLKERPIEKGLILLAGEFTQLLPYVDVSQLTAPTLKKLSSDWPSGITMLLPKKKHTSKLLSGKFESIAVRVTRQVDVVALCQLSKKPIVSTSANLSGQEPAKTWQTLDATLTQKVDLIIKGDTLGYSSPSKIIDALTGHIIRQ